MFDHRIKNREQLAHTSDQSDFENFALGPQTFIEVPNHGVASGGDQRSHVESTAHRGSATPNGAPTFKRAAVAIERREAGQSGDLFAIEFSELGQLSEQGMASDWTDTGDTEEQIFVLFPDRAMLDASVKVFVGALQFLFQPAKVSVDAFSHSLGGRSQPVSLGPDHLDDLSSASGERSELQGHRVRQGTQRRAHRFSEASQHIGIDTVGLGQLSGGFSEVPDLARVDNDDRQLGTSQSMGHWAFQPTCGLQHDQCGLDFSQPFDQILDAGLVVSDRFSLARRTYSDIESRFGHIDTDKNRSDFQNSILLNFSFLQLSSTLRKMRAWLALATVRAFREPGRDDPCSPTVSCDLGVNDLSRPVSC